MENANITVNAKEAEPVFTNGDKTQRHHYKNYETLLKTYGFCYSIDYPRLVVNVDRTHAGWVIHVSIIRAQAEIFLSRLFSFLKHTDFGFDLPINSVLHESILDGGYGYHNIGKFINLYIADPGLFYSSVLCLVEMSSDLMGPAIPTAYHLKNSVYASYQDLSGKNIELKKRNHPDWPFRDFKCQVVKPIKWLKGKYFVTQNLKGDGKGNVYRALNFSKWTNISWCIIKQGKAFQCYDDGGRDISDRLKWQFDVQTKLCKIISVPIPIDFFEQNGDTYFAMEFIEGDSLNDFISALQGGCFWDKIDQAIQIKLVDVLIQAVDLIGELHHNGFLHRDLSPENFIVTSDNRLYAIDIELCYNFQESKPQPFFTLGTEGYMSPNQRGCMVPQSADDIYGLGGLLIRTFTGISPTKFADTNSTELYESLAFFIKNQRLLSLICGCWDSDPERRPNLRSIRHTLELLQALVLTANTIGSTKLAKPLDVLLPGTLESAIKSIWSKPLFSDNKTWWTKTLIDDPKIGNELKSESWYPGFYSGVSGILYLLSLGDQTGFDLGKNRDAFYDNFELVKAHFNAPENNAPAGLMNGAAGLAVLIATMIRNGQLDQSISNLDLIAKLLSLKSMLLNIADGISGQGIAMMKCARLINFPAFGAGLEDIVLTILKAQKSDGSWDVKQRPEDNGVKIYSLLQGIAGITYLLMLYGEQHFCENAKTGALKALRWLLKNRTLLNGQQVWTVNIKSSSVEPWMEYGFSGVAFMFIKAFEIYNEPFYKDAAVSALLSHPYRITSNYFSQAAGLAGLGEIYLEAHAVFKNEEWLERANHIAAFFLHVGKISDNGEFYWLDGSDSKPQPGFMTGQSGIIHFLLRCQNPSKVKFPILSI
jgi:serine/threonine protein kinase